MSTPRPLVEPRPLIGRCEATDIVPTEDDAEYVRCVNRGVRVFEHNEFGHGRTRIVCAFHRSLTDTKPS